MRKYLLLTILLFIFAIRVLGAPTNSMSITPAASDATVIQASDENTRNNEISTKFNAHDHNDIDQTANTLNMGDATAGNKTLTAYNADPNKPFIRYDDTANAWYLSQNGTVSERIFTYSDTTPGAIGTFTRSLTAAAGTQVVTGVGFPSSMVTFFGSETSDEPASWGFDDGNISRCMFNDENRSNTITYDVTNSIMAMDGNNVYQAGQITTIGTDGFTITWVKVSTPAGIFDVLYQATK